MPNCRTHADDMWSLALDSLTVYEQRHLKVGAGVESLADLVRAREHQRSNAFDATEECQDCRAIAWKLGLEGQ